MYKYKLYNTTIIGLAIIRIITIYDAEYKAGYKTRFLVMLNTIFTTIRYSFLFW